MSDGGDRLRFGDLTGGDEGAGGGALFDRVVEIMVTGIVFLILLYVLWKVAASLFFTIHFTFL